jgi:hypothetical protein
MQPKPCAETVSPCPPKVRCFMMTPFEYDESSMPIAQKIHNPLKMQSIVDAGATVARFKHLSYGSNLG